MGYENRSSSDLKCSTRHRGYPGAGIMEGDCTHNPEDWNNKSIKWKCGETFQGRHAAQTKNKTLTIKVRKGAKIRNRYSQVPHLTQDTNWKVTNSQLDTTNESQEVSPFPAGDHKAHINRRSQRHSKEKNIKDSQKKYRLGTVSKIVYWRA